MKHSSLLSTLVLAGAAWSTPTLHQITGWSLSPDVYDSGAEAVILTDTDGKNDDATAFLFFEIAGMANENQFGIYGYTTLSDGTVVVGETLQLFSGSNSPLYGATLAWNSTHTQVKNMTTQATANIGVEFGFYIARNDGFIAYSHGSLNGGTDMALIFDTSERGEWFLFGSDVVVAFEDLPGGGDRDYNDLVVGITDVRPIPEPGTLGLMGLGMLAVGFVARRRAAKA